MKKSIFEWVVSLLIGVVIAILLTTFVGSRYTVKGDSMYPNLKTNKQTKTTEFLTENFNVSDLKNSNGKNKIPKNKYLVLGDNRLISNDSRRDVGLLDKDKVVGKVFVRLLPLSDFKFDFYSKSFNKVNK